MKIWSHSSIFAEAGWIWQPFLGQLPVSQNKLTLIPDSSVQVFPGSSLLSQFLHHIIEGNPSQKERFTALKSTGLKMLNSRRFDLNHGRVSLKNCPKILNVNVRKNTAERINYILDSSNFTQMSNVHYKFQIAKESCHMLVSEELQCTYDRNELKWKNSWYSVRDFFLCVPETIFAKFWQVIEINKLRSGQM